MNPLEYAAQVIKSGGVVAYPTEACYGLGCDPRNNNAIRRILRMKRRQKSKGLILIADRRPRLNPYIEFLPEQYRSEILESWPGPFTWLLPAKESVSRWLRGSHDSIAVRITAHKEAKTLCRLAGMALVSTSANRSGKPMLTNAEQVSKEFSGEVDYIVPGRIGRFNSPSTIRDGLTGATIRG